mmetsp:Transcript_31336/g.94797  ORF Transcript_31336/g.94797 Transcript_31336/m.94797 type:complete len:288 (-) Transcript_31336:369-1232(-)
MPTAVFRTSVGKSSTTKRNADVPTKAPKAARPMPMDSRTTVRSVGWLCTAAQSGSPSKVVQTPPKSMTHPTPMTSASHPTKTPRTVIRPRDTSPTYSRSLASIPWCAKKDWLQTNAPYWRTAKATTPPDPINMLGHCDRTVAVRICMELGGARASSASSALSPSFVAALAPLRCSNISDSGRRHLPAMATTPGTKATKKGTRQPQALKRSSPRADSHAYTTPTAARKPKLTVMLISDISLPRLRCEPTSQRYVDMVLISPAVLNPWIKRKTMRPHRPKVPRASFPLA